MKIIAESDRLIIREFQENDLLNLYKIENDRRIIKYIPWNKLSTLNDCKRQLKNIIDSYEKNKLNSWAVTIKNTDEVIGITQLVYSKKLKGIEIGTKIMPEYWNKGYASELTKAVINYGLHDLDIFEIIAVTDINNSGAIKSLENCGMKFKKYGYYNGAQSVFYSAKK